MKILPRLFATLGLALLAAVAFSKPAQADYDSHRPSSSAGNYRYHYSHRQRQDRPTYINSNPSRYSRNQVRRYRDPWCPTHQNYHQHSYGYYGFNGGYFGVYDGNSHEERFSRGYDRGYRDGYENGRRSLYGNNAFRRGYELGYSHGYRDAVSSRPVGRRPY